VVERKEKGEIRRKDNTKRGKREKKKTIMNILFSLIHVRDVLTSNMNSTQIVLDC
jgi:hypothetical protein